ASSPVARRAPAKQGRRIPSPGASRSWPPTSGRARAVGQRLVRQRGRDLRTRTARHPAPARIVEAPRRGQPLPEPVVNVAAYRLKPWNQVVRPHDDILSGNLEMSTYAADLGAVDRNDPNTPRVYREASEFFRTTFLTRNLRELLANVLDVVAGGSGDRVIQLRTPFRGGQTHALLALYHLMKSRDRVDVPGLADLPDPGPGRVAVLSGMDLDPLAPREVDGLKIHTLWGELAFRLGGQAAYEKVRQHDEQWKPPGGNVL